jgi:hypothetical protein
MELLAVLIVISCGLLALDAALSEWEAYKGE